MEWPSICSVCAEEASTSVNGVAACPLHMEAVLSFAIQLEAMEKGVDPEYAETQVRELLRGLRDE